MDTMQTTVIYDLVRAVDIPDAYAIEVAGFPADEAASLEAFQYRQAQASDLFLGAFILTSEKSRTLIGYVCSTLSASESLTHESMSTHVPGAPSVCIHSICVAQGHRHNGVALALLKEYVSRLQVSAKDGAPYQRILLITHEDLMVLYSKAGFETVGKSAVVHGSRPWFEMRKTLSPAVPSVNIASPQIPTGLWEALERSSTSRSRPIARLLPAFANGVLDLVLSGTANKHDLLCPRTGCGSVILKAKVASLEEKLSAQLEPAGRENPHLAPLPTPPALTHWWKITPDAMAFENIGFSRAVGSQIPNPSGGGRNLKLLLCAECDLGPLGWCEEGGNEFWLAASRVGYRE